MNADTPLRSKDLTRLTGATPRALRHYHRIGLLPEPPRDANGYRRYSATDLVRVLRIRQFTASGVPLRRAAELLEGNDTIDDAVLDEVDRELERQAASITAQRQMLARLRQRLPVSSATGPTRQLDEHLWTLLRARNSDPTTLASLEAVASAVAADTSGWYAEFEELETSSDIRASNADSLATKMAEFYQELNTPRAGDFGFELMEFAPELVRQYLSAAQYRVWRLFLAKVGANENFQGGTAHSVPPRPPETAPRD